MLFKEPDFKMRQQAWVIVNNKPRRGYVSEIFFGIFDNDDDNDEQFLACTGYRIMWSAELFRPHEMYNKLEEVEKLTQWHQVSLEKDKWELAIGNPTDEMSFEQCELSICCTTMAATRSILLVCQKAGGLIKRDVDELRQLLSSHEYPCSPSGERPRNLDEIIKQLGLLDSTTNHK